MLWPRVQAWCHAPPTRLRGCCSCVCVCSCDDVWLPHFEFINVRGFSQDRVVRYGIRLPQDSASDAVGWWVHMLSEQASQSVHPHPQTCTAFGVWQRP